MKFDFLKWLDQALIMLPLLALSTLASIARYVMQIAESDSEFKLKAIFARVLAAWTFTAVIYIASGLALDEPGLFDASLTKVMVIIAVGSAFIQELVRIAQVVVLKKTKALIGDKSK